MTSDTRDEDTNIGNVLRQLLLIHGGQLREALELKAQREGAKLGACLVETGAITQAELDDALELQKGLRGPKAAEAAERLLKAALKRQAEKTK